MRGDKTENVVKEFNIILSYSKLIQKLFCSEFVLSNIRFQHQS